MTPTMIWIFLSMPTCWVLFGHAVADFKVQTDWQAKNKSKSNEALLRHIGTYALTLASFCLPIWYLMNGSVSTFLFYILINASLHFCTDFITSRMSSKYYAEGDHRSFWFIIGMDQLAHQIPLILLLPVVLV
jgi:hypothetical protein